MLELVSAGSKMSQVCFDMTVIGVRCPCPYLDLQALSSYFISCFLLKKGSESVAMWTPSSQQLGQPPTPLKPHQKGTSTLAVGDPAARLCT